MQRPQLLLVQRLLSSTGKTPDYPGDKGVDVYNILSYVKLSRGTFPLEDLSLHVIGLSRAASPISGRGHP
jgi:hypothetical protein